MRGKGISAGNLVTAMAVGLLQAAENVETSASGKTDEITLNYWTWFPSTDQLEETIRRKKKIRILRSI